MTNMMNLMAEDHAIIFPKTGFRIPMMLWGIFSYFPTMKSTVDALQARHNVYILTPTTWNPHMDVHGTNEDSTLDWEGNIKEKRKWASQVVLEDVDDHIDASSLIISVIEKKAIDEEMMHHECEEEETIKYNPPLIDMSVIAGILTALDENIFSRMLTECGQLSREKMIIGATTANDSPYLVDDPDDQEGHSDDNCDTQHSDDDCDTQSGDDEGSAQDDDNEQIDDHDFDEIFVTALDVPRPGTVDVKHFPTFGGLSIRMQSDRIPTKKSLV